MKLLRNVLNNTFSTFAVLSLVFAILCKAGVLLSQPYTEVVFPLLLMSTGTSVFIALREALLPNVGVFKYAIEIAGCTAIILFSVRAAGWLELRIPYLLLVFAMVVTVYVAEWLITWLQSKHDEKDLNGVLGQRKTSEESGK